MNVSQHKGVNHGPITCIDVNSMYPGVMMNDPLPHGMPVRIPKPNEDDYPLWVVKAQFKLTVKPGVTPVYKFTQKADADLEGIRTADSVTACQCWHELTFTNIDIANYSRFYDIRMKKGTAEYMGFRCAVGMFNEYIAYWYQVKKTAPKGSLERDDAKRMMNSCYGRFGLNPNMTDTGFVFNEDIADIVTREYPMAVDGHNAYLPIAMFVTAHARRRLCDVMLRVGCENVLHCDTDSCKFLGTPDMVGDLLSDTELGLWKDEGHPIVMIEGGVKRYIEFAVYPPRDMSDIMAFTCAGMPQKSTDDGVPVGMWVEVLDDPMLICSDGYVFGQAHYRIKSQWLRDLYLKYGMDPDDVDTMRSLKTNVKGGCILIPTTFTLNDNMRSRMR